MGKYLVIFFYMLFSVCISKAQQNNDSFEKISSLRVNSQLFNGDDLENFQLNKLSDEEISYFILDTLLLPFVDDFSTNKLKKYNTDLYNSSYILDSVSFDFTVDAVVVDTFVCYFDTTWSFVFDTTDSMVSKTEQSKYQIVYYNDTYNPFIPSDTSQCWLPFSIYDTIGIVDTTDTVFSILADTLVNSIDTLKVYPPDTGIVSAYNSKWVDNYIYINSTYPVDPITIGVATFDGLNELGKPYNEFSDPLGHGIADYLTSKPIDLNKTILDSVYLSFYYQPQGYGNDPQAEDSLVLEFFSPQKREWNHIWSTAGKSLDQFRQVLIFIDNPEYLLKGFQFRFKNYATLSGNLDHWNVDYVRLDDQRNAGDSVVYLDMAHVYSTSSILNSYQAMPWKHFLNDTIAQLSDSLIMVVSNNDSGTVNLNYEHQFNTPFDSVFAAPIVNNLNVQSYEQIGSFRKADQMDYLCYSPSDNCFFPNQDSAVIEVMSILNVANDPNRNNDTLRIHQEFYNYYAYDDGSAEAAYGLNANGAKLAYRFNINTTDTLRAIDIHFSQVMEDVTEEFFYLTVWSSLDPEIIVYQQSFQTPYYEDSLNKFHTYLLDDQLILNGTFYIGWVQTSSEMLNVGFDKNNDASSQLYYNASGTWLNSIIDGAVMMRPLFGDTIYPYVGIDENQSFVIDQNDFILFPNPTSNKFYITTNNQYNQNTIGEINVELYNLYGQLVNSFNSVTDTGIDVSKFPKGVYLVKITSDIQKEPIVKRLIVGNTH